MRWAVERAGNWLQDYLGSTPAANTGSWALPLARRALLIVVAVMAIMVSLDVLGVNITPLIAGLGIGGLAVALAIQPTLSNLFAGTYVITEGVVSPGDYIDMEGGVSGYVVDVNWRSTRLRTWGNNLVVVPNSRFAETIITNYSKPDEHVNVYLTCGVAYESDLQRVGNGQSTGDGSGAGRTSRRGAGIWSLFRLRYFWRKQHRLLAVRAGQRPAGQL